MANTKNINKKSTALIWLVIIAVIFSELFVYVWIRTESSNAALRISKARTQLSEEQSYNQALLVEREWLKSHAQLTKIAAQRFKLSPVSLNKVIYLETVE